MQPAIRLIAASRGVFPNAELVRRKADAPGGVAIEEPRRGDHCTRRRGEADGKRYVGKWIRVGFPAWKFGFEYLVPRNASRRRSRPRNGRRRGAVHGRLHRLAEGRAQSVAVSTVLRILDEQQSDRAARAVAPRGHPAGPAMHEQPVFHREPKRRVDLAVGRATDKSRAVGPQDLVDCCAREHAAVFDQIHLQKLRHVPHRRKHTAVGRVITDLE